MANRCIDCGKKCLAYPRCQSCKSKLHHRIKAAKAKGWTFDCAGGAYWCWDKIGNVLAGPVEPGNGVYTKLLDVAEG